MENVCGNANASIPNMKRGRWSLSRRAKPGRKSLVQFLVKDIDDNESCVSSCTVTSTDDEWNNIQASLAKTRELEEEFEQEFEFEQLTKRKPKMSLGTINRKRDELELVKKSVDLDDELEYLQSFIDSMEENFKTLFSEITYKRCAAEFEEIHKRKPAPINYCEIVEELNLRIFPHTEWAYRIEEAIVSNLK